MEKTSGFKLYCCGSRGTRPIEGRRFNEFGGYTSCYILKKDDYALIIDCGTGLYAGNPIIENCTHIDVCISHMHYDHILGLLNWNNFPKGSKMTFYAGFDGWFGMDTFKQFFSAPFWPYNPDFNLVQTPSVGVPLKLKKGISVEFYPAPHPNNAQLMLIRLHEADGEHRIAVMFDTERTDGLDFDLVKGCDLLIYDGTFTDEEYLTRVGYGHSTWQTGARFAKEVECKRLIITHHDPDREDTDLRAFEKQAREIFPSTDFARAGQCWEFPIVSEYIADKGTVKKSIFNKLYDRIIGKIDEVIFDERKLSSFTITVGIVIAGAVSIFMTIVNIFTGKTLLMYSTMIFAFICLIIALMQTVFKANIKVIIGCFSFVLVALFTFFIVSGTPEGFSALWCLLIPTATMVAFGRKSASLLSLLMFAIIIFFFDTPIGQTFLQYDYTESFKLRFPMAFVAFYCLSLFLETVRKRTSDELSRIKKNQENIISDQTSELRDQNFRLLNANSSLAIRNRLLNKTFGRNLEDENVSDYLDDPDRYELNGDKCYVTLLKSDLSGFSAMCDGMDAMKQVDMLNNYLDVMTDIIQSRNGTIIEYVGDSILAVFGAPIKDENHADNAIAAALEMQKNMKKVNKYNRSHGYPLCESRIGLHTGEVVIGTIGTDFHFKYDAIGKSAKILASIQRHAAPGMVLATENTIRAADSKIHTGKMVKVSVHRMDTSINVAYIDSIGRPYTISSLMHIETPKLLEEPIDVTFKVAEGNISGEMEGKILGVDKGNLLLACSYKLAVYDRLRIDYDGGMICVIVDKNKEGYLLRLVYSGSGKHAFDIDVD